MSSHSAINLSSAADKSPSWLPPVANPLSLIPKVNYFALVATLEILRDLVGRHRAIADDVEDE